MYEIKFIFAEKERNTSLHSNNELENPVANISSDSGNTSEVFEPVQFTEVRLYIFEFKVVNHIERKQQCCKLAYFYSQEPSSSFAELEASIAALHISRKSDIATPLGAAANQSQASDICITGTPSLSGMRTVALNKSDMSSLTVTVTFGGDQNKVRKSPCEVNETEREISSPRDKVIANDTDVEATEDNELKEQVSEVEKRIRSPCDSAKDHLLKTTKSNMQQKEATKSVTVERQDTEKENQQADSQSEVDINQTNANIKVAQGQRDSSVSDMELNRGSVTDSPSANIFRTKVNNLSMTPLSELDHEAEEKTEKDAANKQDSLLVSDISAGIESEISDCSVRADDTQTSVIESGAEDRLSSANTSQNKSSNLSHHTSANANTSQHNTPQEGTFSKTLPLQVQRILDDHDQNLPFPLNKSLSELDNMVVSVEATSTPAAGKSKTMKVVNSNRFVLIQF